MGRNSFGFTMVEVMIVLLILGIISAVAVPALNNTMDEIKLDGAAREVVSAIQYTQSLAIKEGKEHGVEFFPSEDRFRCYKRETDETVIHVIDKKPYDINFVLNGHLQGVDLVSTTFSNSEVEFNTLGEPLETGSIVLSYGGTQTTIDVSGIIGKVTVN